MIAPVISRSSLESLRATLAVEPLHDLPSLPTSFSLPSSGSGQAFQFVATQQAAPSTLSDVLLAMQEIGEAVSRLDTVA